MFQLFRKSKQVLLIPSVLLLMLSAIFLISPSSPQLEQRVAAATPTPLPAPSLEHLVPPQQIVLSPYAKDVKSGDFDGDGYADLVYTEYSERTLLINGSGQPLLQLQIQVLLNRGGDKTLSQVPQFSAPITLRPVTSSRLDEIRRNLGVGPLDEEAWVNRLKAGGVEIADINGDGLLDLVVWSEAAAQAYIYWNQTGRAGDIFAQAHSNSDTSKQTTLNMPADGHMMPVRCAVADFDGDRMTDLAFYLSTVIQKDGSKYGPKGLQIESLWPVLRKETSPYGFDTTTPMIPIGLGKDVDGIEAGGRLFHHSMPPSADLLPVTGSPFLDAARRMMMSEDGLKARDVASHPMNTGRVMQVERGKAGAADAVWFSGTGYVRRFIFDVKARMFRSTQTMASGGNGMELIGLSDGSLALAMSGGKQIRYGDLATGGKAASSAERSYFLDAGAYLKSVKLGGGMAMLSTLHYQRPGEGVDQVGFDYRALANGQSIESDSLLLIEYIRESSEAGELQVSPLLEGMDRRFVQAIPMKASVDHAPAVVAGEFGAKGEISLGVLESGVLKLYRPNNGVAYTAPTMKIDRVEPASNFLAGFVDKGDVTFQGEIAVVEGIFPSTDPPRYVEMRRAGELVAVLSVSQPVTIGSKQLISIPGLKDLPEGEDYKLTFWNSDSSVSIPLRIVKRFLITGSNRDGLANRACGIVESTLAGKVYPGEFRVQVNNYKSGTLEQAQLVRVSDGAVRNVALGASGAREEGGEIVFPIPGDIANGQWQLQLKSDGYWQRLNGKAWEVNRDKTVCGNLVKPINDRGPRLCDDETLYTKTLTDGKGLTLHGGDLEFLGSGFRQWDVQSVVLEQGGVGIIWDDAPAQPDGDRILKVNFGNLEKKLTDGQPVNVKFYPAKRADVEAYGIPPIGQSINWRKAKEGECGTLMTPEAVIPGELEQGKEVTITGKGLAHSGNVKLRMTLPDGTKYEISGAKPTDDWFKVKQSNSTGASVKLTIPLDLTPYKVGTSRITSGGDCETCNAAPIVVGVVIVVEYMSASTGTVAVLASAGLVLNKLLRRSPTTPAPGPTDPEPDGKERTLWLVKYLVKTPPFRAAEVQVMIVQTPKDVVYNVAYDKAKKAISKALNISEGEVAYGLPDSYPNATALIRLVTPAQTKDGKEATSPIGVQYSYRECSYEFRYFGTWWPASVQVTYDGGTLAESEVRWRMPRTVTIGNVRVGELVKKFTDSSHDYTWVE